MADGLTAHLLMCAVHEGNEEQLRTLIESEGFSETADGGYTLLLEAMRYRNYAIARLLITNGAKVNIERMQQHFNPFDTPLHMAIRHRKMHIADMLLSRGADIYASGGCGISSICQAIRTGTLEFLELLFNRGVDLNAKGPDGLRPLHIAVMEGNEDAVTLLLSYGADIDASSSDNRTALFFAAESVRLKVVKLLLQFEPDVNNEGNRKALYDAMPYSLFGNCKMIVESLLGYGFVYELEAGCDPMFFHGAIEQGFTEIVEDLLAYGADVNMNYWGAKPLHLATKNQQTDIAELFVSYGADVNAQDREEKTPIYHAVKSGNAKLVKILLTHGATVNDNLHVLQVAISERRPEIVEELLKFGADVNVDNSGQTPLMLAIKNVDLSLVEVLLKNGAEADKDNDGVTPLLMTIKSNKPDFAELLLSYGADVNAQDRLKKTPIHYPAESGNVKLFNILLTHGATISDYPRFVHAAISGKSPEIVEQLLNLGNVHINDCTYEGTPALIASLQRSSAEVTALLLDKGADVNVRCEKYQDTPLHVLSDKGDHRSCEIMLKKGAAVCAKNILGRTPLHCAVNAEIVKKLIHSGADIDARDLDGRTPLHTAVKAEEKIVVDALLKFDADIDSIDKKGKTALHLACRTLQAPTVRLLLDFGADINICDNYDTTPMDRAYSYFFRRFDQEIVELMIKKLFFHIDKMEMISLYVSDKNLAVKRQAQDLPFLSERVIAKQRQHCKKEISKLQTMKINSCNVTYYEFLTKNSSSLAFLMGNENILQTFQPGNANAEEFPNYAPLLKLQFRKAMERKGLVEQCYEIFGFLCHELPPLPTYCVEEIFQYFNNKDLQMFVALRGPRRLFSIKEQLMDQVIDDSSDLSEISELSDYDGCYWSDDSF